MIKKFKSKASKIYKTLIYLYKIIKIYSLIVYAKENILWFRRSPKRP